MAIDYRHYFNVLCRQEAYKWGAQDDNKVTTMFAGTVASLNICMFSNIGRQMEQVFSYIGRHGSCCKEPLLYNDIRKLAAGSIKPKVKGSSSGHGY